MPKQKEKTPLGHVVKKTRKVKPKLWKTAQSLKPNTQFMDLLTLPNPTERVRAMQEAWRFHEPIREAILSDIVAVADWGTFGTDAPLQAPEHLNGLKLSIKQVNFLIGQHKKECSKCGETFPPALDFHHRDPQEKLFSISDFVRQQHIWKRNLQELYDEIEKCDVLCATCHRKVEYGFYEK
jgi:hypothetical protein